MAMYEVCKECRTVYMNPEYFLSKQSEKERYDLHNNTEEDQRYVDYMYYNMQECLSLCDKKFSIGSYSLDYGCGATQIMSNLLESEGLCSISYDPLYFPIELKKAKFDLITAIEVVEHFNNPAKEWQQLFDLLAPDGVLVVRTQLITDVVDFENWWYKNDPTHVTFYHDIGLEWIANKYNRKLKIKNNFIAFL